MEQGATHREDLRRYIRINPDIGRDPPQLDAKGEVGQLQLDVAQYLEGAEARIKLEDVVFRLVASSFYFERTHATRDVSRGTAKVRGKLNRLDASPLYISLNFTGKLQCRFEESSIWAKEMGVFFKGHQRADFQPCFDTWDGIEQHSRDKVS